MYMIVVTIDTPGWRASAAELRAVLHASLTNVDRLEHLYLEAHPDRIDLSLYLQAPDEAHAAVMADQLCRRTMAAIAGARRWSMDVPGIGL